MQALTCQVAWHACRKELGEGDPAGPPGPSAGGSSALHGACAPEGGPAAPQGACAPESASAAPQGARAPEGGTAAGPAAVHGVRLYRDGLRRILDGSLQALAAEKKKKDRKRPLA